MIIRGESYRGYNSVKLNVGGVLTCEPFDITGLQVISSSVIIRKSNGGNAVMMLVMTDGDGRDVLIRSVSTDDLPANKFNTLTLKVENVKLPDSAVKATIQIINNGSNSITVSCMKCESGRVATDFSNNLDGNTTLLTPQGIYTGTIQANQVIVSDERLPDKLTTINAGIIELKNNLQHTNANIKTTIESGLIQIARKVDGNTTSIATMSDKVLSLSEVAQSAKRTADQTNNAITNIQAGRIKLEGGWNGAKVKISALPEDVKYGDVININDNFKVDAKGNITAINGTFSGELVGGKNSNAMLHIGDIEESYYGGLVGTGFQIKPDRFIASTGRIANCYMYDAIIGSGRIFGGVTLGRDKSMTITDAGIRLNLPYHVLDNPAYSSASVGPQIAVFENTGDSWFGLYNGDPDSSGSVVYSIDRLGGVYKRSDSSVKTNITKCNNRKLLEFINSINVYEFQYTWDQAKRINCGVLADEILKENNVFGNRMVRSFNSTDHMVEYDRLFMYGIGAIKALITENNMLKDEISQLKTEISDIKKAIHFGRK